MQDILAFSVLIVALIYVVKALFFNNKKTGTCGTCTGHSEAK